MNAIKLDHPALGKTPERVDIINGIAGFARLDVLALYAEQACTLYIDQAIVVFPAFGIAQAGDLIAIAMGLLDIFTRAGGSDFGIDLVLLAVDTKHQVLINRVAFIIAKQAAPAFIVAGERRLDFTGGGDPFANFQEDTIDGPNTDSGELGGFGSC